MAKRVKYKMGDVFSFILEDEGNKGYGKIVKIDSDIIFIELYKLKPIKEGYTLDNIKSATVLLSIWSESEGIKKSIWSIIGNITVDENYIMPNFWTKSAFTGKILLIRGSEKFETPKNAVEISEEQIGDAQPYGIFDYEAVRITYVGELEKYGLY